jgi:hypothetical protein
MRATQVFERVKTADSAAAGWAWLRLQAGLHYAHRGHLARRRTVPRYLALSPDPRLHVGAGGGTIPGWLDSDLVSGDIFLDLSRALPLPDSCFRHVFGEHVIEHISEPEGVSLLTELHRIDRTSRGGHPHHDA